MSLDVYIRDKYYTTKDKINFDIENSACICQIYFIYL